MEGEESHVWPAQAAWSYSDLTDPFLLALLSGLCSEQPASPCLGLLGAHEETCISNKTHLKLNSATVYSTLTGSGLNKLPQHGKKAAGRNFNLGLVFFNDSSLQQYFKKLNQCGCAFVLQASYTF